MHLFYEFLVLIVFFLFLEVDGLPNQTSSRPLLKKSTSRTSTHRALGPRHRALSLKNLNPRNLTTSKAIPELSCGISPVKPDLKAHLYFDTVSPNKRKPSRIVGGSIAKPYSWPWQVVWCEMIRGNCSFQCGGTVIHNRWVLTAGHCVNGRGRLDRPDKFRVKTGVFVESSTDEPGETIHMVKAIHLHPNYRDVYTPENDIALIEIDPPVVYSQYVQPICLASSDYYQIQSSNTAWATGWGLTQEDGYSSNRLRQVNIPFNSYLSCKQAYRQGFKQQMMICAGTQGKDSCQGDSGGPLQQSNQHGRWFQFGITSYGEGCARAGFPGVYARVSYFCSFIRQTTKNEVTCHNPNFK